jgi:hypothetical protein
MEDILIESMEKYEINIWGNNYEFVK